MCVDKILHFTNTFIINFKIESPDSIVGSLIYFA